MAGTEVISRLLDQGWRVKSRDGSQVKLTNGDKVVIVPVEDDKPLSMGLLLAIEKQTGVVLT